MSHTSPKLPSQASAFGLEQFQVILQEGNAGMWLLPCLPLASLLHLGSWSCSPRRAGAAGLRLVPRHGAGVAQVMAESEVGSVLSSFGVFFF